MRFDFPPSFDLAVLNQSCPADAETELMMKVIDDVWALNRTLVSDGYDESLERINKIIPLDVIKTPSGSEVWTWKVPQKWTVKEAWLKANGKKICDFKDHPLHLASYSVPFSGTLTKDELLPHLYFTCDRPKAIPYVYLYHKKDWGLCLSYDQFQQLGDGPFEVKIDTKLEDGTLSVGESVLPGDNPESIVLCAHLCHPAQVNDGLSGAAVGIALMKRLAALPRRRYTYRLVLCPENIGSLCYLNSRKKDIPNMRYGIFLEMLGNKNHLKLQYSRQGDTELDRLAEHVLAKAVPVYGTGKFRKVICNDEINFNGPGINIPTISLSRWPYPEYHTSDDNPDNISRNYLKESLEVCWQILMNLENNVYPKRRYVGNLFLSKYGLYEDLNVDDTIEQIILSLEGDLSVLEIAEKLALPLDKVQDYVAKFQKAELIDMEHSPK